MNYRSGFWVWLFMVNSWSQEKDNVNGDAEYALVISFQNKGHEIKEFSKNGNEKTGLSLLKTISPGKIFLETAKIADGATNTIVRTNTINKTWPLYGSVDFTNSYAYGAPEEKMVLAGNQLNVSHSMAATGARLWLCGIAMQMIGIGWLSSGYFSPYENSHLIVFAGFFFGGMSLDFLGPIPAFLGENKAKNAIKQYDNNPLGKKSGMTSSRYYGLSWLLCGGSLIAWTTMNTDYPGFGFTFASGTYFAALILRGVSAISPSRRILHFKNGLSLHPNSNLRDNIGLAVNYDF